VFIRTTIALSAALVLATATTTVAMAKGKAKSDPRAAFALSGPATLHSIPTVFGWPLHIGTSNPVVGYDTGGAAIFQRRPTPGCPVSLKQQSRC
jgi:hypothetical protein